MSDLRALLLLDIVDSTRVSEQIGDVAMAELRAAHDRTSRDLLRKWDGREIDKSDGFLLLFREVASAAAYALAYHRALSDLRTPLRARAGIHFGPVGLRQNTAAEVALGAKALEVDGLALPTTARVMSVAQGGQTLLTASAKEALGDPAPLRLTSHGHWRMKGLEAPFELFEVGENDALMAPPPDSAKAYRVAQHQDLWLPVRDLNSSLPAERDAFIGRQSSLRDLARRLDAGARLVSVVGTGGAGKTRLARRFGWLWLGDFPGGASFCDLTQARSLDGILHAVAQGLGVALGRADPIAQLGHAIAARGACLVILDNFEQVVRYAEETVGVWLERTKDARFIATTREVLGIAGEEVMHLAPLAADEASALFVQRAAAANREFQPKSEDHAAIEQLVGLLDGLPLAIELAAVRVRVMPPRTLLHRMGERFKLLVSRGGRHDRQVTLRATFDWSWELLSGFEKAALAQLSVFEGGFALAAAEAVMDLAGFPDPPSPLDVLQSLVEKSLVRQVREDRFDLLSTLQEYAAEQLTSTGRFPGAGPTARTRALTRHWNYFAALNEVEAVADGCAEIENLVAACRRATSANDGEAASGALTAAWAALLLCGPFRFGLELAGLVRDIEGLNARQRIRVSRVAGRSCQAMGRIDDARGHFEAALALAEASADAASEGAALACIAELDLNVGRMEDAGGRFDRALQIAQRLDDRRLECDVRNGLGTYCENLGRFDEAETHYQCALTVARSIGHRRWEGGALGNLGQLCANQGKHAAARPLYEASILLARELGDRQWEGNGRCNLGLLHFATGRLASALDELNAALSIARQMGHLRLECIVLCNLGLVHDAAQRPRDARECYETALAIARRSSDRRSEGQFLIYLALLNAREGCFADARACLHAGEELLVAVSDRPSLGLLLCARAETEHLAGNRDGAYACLDQAKLVSESVATSPESELGVALMRAAAMIDGNSPQTSGGG